MFCSHRRLSSLKNAKWYFARRLQRNPGFSTKRFFCGSIQTPPISRKNLKKVFLCAAIPMVGFGFVDNTIMIRVGDAIDAGLGARFGLATLTAAAMGQIISDSSGVVFGNTLDAVFSKFGLKPPNITQAQRQLRSFRIATTAGACVGVIFGCCLGMVNLLFLDLDAKEKQLRQKELETIYSMVMEEGPNLFHCHGASLFLYDEDRNSLWSKTICGHKGLMEIPVKDHGLTSWVLRNGKMINTPDAYTDPRFDSSIDKRTGFKTTSLLAFPIIYEERVRGVLMFLNKENAQPFGEDDVQLAHVFSKHIGIFMQKFQAETHTSEATVFESKSVIMIDEPKS